MMRKAILSAVLAALFVLGCIAQEPPKPKPAEPAAQPKSSGVQESERSAVPSPGVDVDPSKMATPASNGNSKPANAVPVDAKSYVLGAEDMIFITVWRSPEFSGQHMIRPDGKITINLVGEVQASGLTPEALGASIKERLRKVLVDPDVSVSVTQVNSRRYFIEGEVLKPGEYKLVVPTRILEALVNAGGFKDFAKQTDIRIIRGATVLHFNYKTAIRGKNAGKSADQNVFLEPGDIIIVR
jgi:polysaccharide biosynthesis/export protein